MPTIASGDKEGAYIDGGGGYWVEEGGVEWVRGGVVPVCPTCYLSVRLARGLPVQGHRARFAFHPNRSQVPRGCGWCFTGIKELVKKKKEKKTKGVQTKSHKALY